MNCGVVVHDKRMIGVAIKRVVSRVIGSCDEIPLVKKDALS